MEELLELTKEQIEETEQHEETGEIIETIPQAPVQPPVPQPETSALEQELEELRKEKLQRLLMDEASALLNERGIDPGFAAFVLAEDSAATRKKVEQFDRRYAEALRKHLAARLPAAEPRDFSAARPKARRRGIRKV